MGNDSYTLNDYKCAFNEYKQFINIIHKNAQLLSKGYFVEKQNYENFKSIYDNLLIQKQKSLVNSHSQDVEQNISLETLEAYRMNTETIEGLKAGLLNNKEYILINNGLYHLICHETKNTLINFYIKNGDLFICSEDGKKLIMRLRIYSSNIINKFSLYLIPSEISTSINSISSSRGVYNVYNANYNKENNQKNLDDNLLLFISIIK